MSHIDKQVPRSASNAKNEHVSAHVGADVTVQAPALDTITFVIGEGRTYQKVWTPAAMGGGSAQPLVPCIFNHIEERPFNDLRGLMDLLKERGNEGWCAVRGQLRPHADIEAANAGLSGNERLYKKSRDLSGAEHVLYRRQKDKTLADVPRRWALFDLDSPPGSVLDLSSPEKCDASIRTAVAKQLGPEFAIADFAYMLSGSAGIKDGVRVHVWVLFPEPVTNAELKAWRERRIAKLKGESDKEPSVCDGALFNAVQPHFCAPPLFEGCNDPIAEKKLERWRFCASIEDRVVLNDLHEIRAAAAAQGVKGRGGNRVFDKRNPLAVQRTRAPESDRADPHHHRDPVHAAFCRAFDVERAFELIPEERFTVDRSRPDGGLRVTWGERSSEGGCWIDDDRLRISGTYDSWPTTDSGLPQKFDSWEFVAHFRFNEAPNAPAPLMTAFARGLPEVEAELEKAHVDKEDSVVYWSDTPAENGAEMVDALASRGVLYAQGQAIVEITGGLINEVKVPRLRALLDTHGIQLARSKEGGATKRPSATEEKDAAQVGLARFDLPSLNPLHRVVTRPIFQPADGRLLGHGYHKEAKTFVALAAPWDALSIPEKPTHEQLTEAVRFLKDEALEGFEFDTVDDQAAAIALLVTAGCRSGFKTAPAFAVLSEMPGSGKTTLTTMAQIVAGEPKTIPFPKRAEEVAKVILSELMSGAPTINFDNVGTGWHINDPSLNRLIGAEVYSDRELGGNKTPSFANDRLLMLNGNKLQLQSDAATRLVVVNLTPKTERPEARNHKRPDPAAWARENAVHLVTAALTIARWGAQNQGEAGATQTRFPSWEKVVAGAIREGGGGDAVATMLASKRLSDEAEFAPYGDALAALHKKFGDKMFSAGDVSKAVSEASEFCPFEGALTEVCQHSKNAGQVGKMLNQLAERATPLRGRSGPERYCLKSTWDAKRKGNVYQVLRAIAPAEAA